MNRKKAIEIFNILKETYPDARCSLNFSTPFEMLVAVCLSAQCTDERVNKVTPILFKKYSTPNDFSNADINKLEKLIYPCGFYKSKAKNLKAAGKVVSLNYNGVVPSIMNELVTIPGVGRKSANVILLEAFNKPVGIAVDTHVKRLSNRIGFSKETDPLKIEIDLCKIYPKKYWRDINHIYIWHGRSICTSQNPKCDKCPINNLCLTYKKKYKNAKLS